MPEWESHWVLMLGYYTFNSEFIYFCFIHSLVQQVGFLSSYFMRHTILDPVEK